MKWVFAICVLCLLAQTVFSISHRTSLIWTEKAEWGGVKISGVAGDPDDWFQNGTTSVLRGAASPVDFFSRILSHRIALAFQYSSKQLFFSDRGFKGIFQLKLQVMKGDHYSYNATVETVYSGTSVLVYGMAVDWLSGCIYWTDARYNWITVGSTTDYGVYKHLVVTGLDLPMGIAVYPKKGLMFWSDWGVVPKIERSNLGGTDRKLLIPSGLRRPLGLTIDYDENRLYWVDDDTDTVEMADLDGGHRSSFSAKEPGHHDHSLFGIAVYKDFVFVTDQLAMDVRSYRKSTTEYIGRFQLKQSVPYDVMMYSESRQEEMANAECKTMACEHLCISTAGGHGECACSEDFELQADKKTCKMNQLTMQPQYIYSIGNAICKIKINVPDMSKESIVKHLHCFERQVGHVRALGFHSYAELLFYADTEHGTIIRKRLGETDKDSEVIAVQTGHVTGIAVDWIAGHLYWTDEMYGHIMVSDLTGRHQHVILKDLNKPRGIAVDPAEGLLYWCVDGAIYRAALDGSAAVPFIKQDVDFPAGMSLDVTAKRLYWTDGGRIESALVTDTVDRGVHFSNPSETLNDVTVYEDYIAWTTSENMVKFGYKESKKSLRILIHENVTAVYDIVAYSSNLQPLSKSPCDNENGGCNQLCFSKPKTRPMERQCACVFSFYLDKDNKTCLSDLNTYGPHFVLFVDPYRKQAYQLDAGTRGGKLRGVILQSAAFPEKIEYDEQEDKIYWFDPTENAISRESMHGTGKELFHVLPSGHTLGAMVLYSKSRQLFYTDAVSADIVVVSLDTNETRKFHSANFLPGSLAIDNQNGLVFWAEKTPQHTTIFHRSIEGNETRAKASFVTKDDVKGLAVDPDGKYLVWWTSTHVKGKCLNECESNITKVIRSGEDNYTSATVVDHWLYYTTWTSKTVLTVDLHHSANVVSLSANFSRITDMRSYKSTRRPPTTASITTTTSTTRRTDVVVVGTPKSPARSQSLQANNGNLPMFGGIAAGLIALMLLALLLVYIVLRRRRQKRCVPTPPPVKYTSPAHDNPTYMSRDEVQAQAVSLGGATAAAPSLPPSEKRPIEESLGGATDTGKCRHSSTDDTTESRALPPIGKHSLPDKPTTTVVSVDVEVNVEESDTQTENDYAKLVPDTNAA